jgi:hypothetical protein
VNPSGMQRWTGLRRAGFETAGNAFGKRKEYADSPMMNGMRALLGESLDEASADMGAPAGSEGSPNARVASKER